MDGSSDAAVVARVVRGDVEAFGELVARYRDRYFRYAMHMLGNREDAEEALQDAFTRAYRSLSRCDDPERFGAWLFRILVNRCRTSGARRGRRLKTFVSDDTALMDASEEHPAERRAWREEIDRALAITLAALTPEDRASLRNALTNADSEEVRAFWDDARERSDNVSSEFG